MSKQLIDTSSMRPFPIVARMLGVNTTTTKSSTSSSPTFPKIPNPAVMMKTLFEFVVIAICFFAALYINITVIHWGLSLISPIMPIACLWVYGIGCVSLLFIAYLEKNVEDAWKVQLRKRVAQGLDEKGDF